MATIIDTLEYVKELRAAGVPEQQAEAQAKALSRIATEELATKKDIDDLRRDLRELEYRLTIKIGAMTAAAVAPLAAIMKLH